MYHLYPAADTQHGDDTPQHTLIVRQDFRDSLSIQYSGVGFCQNDCMVEREMMKIAWLCRIIRLTRWNIDY